MNKKQELWLCNVSDKNVSIGDLRVTVPARKSINILSNHYNLSAHQINNSILHGSLKKRQKLIKISKGRPDVQIEVPKINNSEEFVKTRRGIATYSRKVLEKEEFEELQLQDEDIVNAITDEDQ